MCPELHLIAAWCALVTHQGYQCAGLQLCTKDSCMMHSVVTYQGQRQGALWLQIRDSHKVCSRHISWINMLETQLMAKASEAKQGARNQGQEQRVRVGYTV